ncbi:hypothetical protein CJ739_3760 [Mariniflexile rhizosphaerae]|uniref:hypothetical protein n=1 Tax=unclassified Mariniflexile TaxID=2643887 RepID=UPI000CB29478|nr:hypothetical protein [Mariniflexile sp. TRM1-10]AXP82820.1 hypothetical protein CJ739_3760 [Mariniflexile sp. TRM1-10]PLB19077.1 MAG: hypothetical protein TRG1_2104 [Flavobacteriaceae bacterium FS1-H7996/R]
MEKIGTIILLLISANIFGQNLSGCGIDNNPKLTQTESEYLNAYLIEKRNGFDFKNKKVIFITGNSGNQIGTKKEYFDYIKKWNKKNSKVATGIEILTDEQKIESDGYDVIVTYWVKVLTKKRKRKILNEIKA